jgi:hypothetical protein
VRYCKPSVVTSETETAMAATAVAICGSVSSQRLWMSRAHKLSRPPAGVAARAAAARPRSASASMVLRMRSQRACSSGGATNSSREARATLRMD